MRACSQVKAIREDKKGKKKKELEKKIASHLCAGHFCTFHLFCGLSAYVYFQSPWGVAFCIFPRVLVVIIGARGSGGLTGSHVVPHMDVFLLVSPLLLARCLLSCRCPRLSLFQGLFLKPLKPHCLLPSLDVVCSFLASVSFPLYWNVRAWGPAGLVPPGIVSPDPILLVCGQWLCVSQINDHTHLCQSAV